ncbi:hypothetical protein Emed_004836 [Eimeria media]
MVGEVIGARLMAHRKISRVLAAKLSLCVRVDALTEAAETAAAAAAAKGGAAAAAAAAEASAAPQAPAEPSVAIACRRYVENKLEQLEQQLSGATAKPTGKASFQRYEPFRVLNGGVKKYDASTDAVAHANTTAAAAARAAAAELLRQQRRQR